jgi:hypothetical protein
MEYELTAGDAIASVDVVLADMAAIAQFTGSQPASEPITRAGGEGGALPVQRTKTRRCACGKCRACIDNARWESVFQQKFADPFYYSLRHPKQGSSLNGF